MNGVPLKVSAEQHRHASQRGESTDDDDQGVIQALRTVALGRKVFLYQLHPVR